MSSGVEIMKNAYQIILNVTTPTIAVTTVMNWLTVRKFFISFY